MRVAATMITATLVLSGCGAGSGGPSVAGGGGADGSPLECGGVSIEDGDVTDLPDLATLPDEVLAAVDDLGEPVLDATLDWRVVARSDEQVVLIRELDPQEPAAADGSSHATAELGPITGAPNLPDGTWFLWGGNSCSPRLAGTEETQADLRLGDHLSPQDTEMTLLVMERACASGRSAEGRIELQDLELTTDEVRVRIGVRPAGGDQECPGNPWTPFTVDLGEPLGDRTVMDANLVPARPLVVGTEEPTFDPEAEDRDAAVERALSFDVPDSYTLRLETQCFCAAGLYEVVVRDGEVVQRRAVEPRPPEGIVEEDPDVALAPSYAELLDRLRSAYGERPSSITDLAVLDDGSIVRVAFDPMEDAIDDEISYLVEGLDVD